MSYPQQQIPIQQNIRLPMPSSQSNQQWPQWQQQQIDPKTPMQHVHNMYIAPTSTQSSFSSHHRAAPYSLPTHTGGKYNTQATSQLQQHPVN